MQRDISLYFQIYREMTHFIKHSYKLEEKEE